MRKLEKGPKQKTVGESSLGREQLCKALIRQVLFRLDFFRWCPGGMGNIRLVG